MQTQPLMVSAVFGLSALGCANQEVVVDELTPPNDPAARFASRRPLERPGPSVDEYGRPMDLRSAIVLEGSCYGVADAPGKYVCVGGPDIVFSSKSSSWIGGGYARGVFVGDAQRMTLYGSTDHQVDDENTRYTSWSFEDDPVHVVTPTNVNGGDRRETIPSWFTNDQAPALRIERWGDGIHDASMRCGARAYRLRPMSGDEQRTVLASTSFSAPPLEPAVYVGETEQGLVVAVARVRDHVGRTRVVAEVGGVEVQVLASSHPEPKVDGGYHHHAPTYHHALVGGGRIILEGFRSRYEPADGEPAQLLTNMPKARHASLRARLEARVLRPSTQRTDHVPLAGPCTALIGSR